LETLTAFAPVVDERVRVLILGSLPGAVSLRQGQYYTNPRNAFRRLASDPTGRDLVPAPYPTRLAALLEAGIDLRDVIASARRREASTPTSARRGMRISAASSRVCRSTARSGSTGAGHPFLAGVSCAGSLARRS